MPHIYQLVRLRLRHNTALFLALKPRFTNSPQQPGRTGRKMSNRLPQRVDGRESDTCQRQRSSRDFDDSLKSIRLPRSIEQLSALSPIALPTMQSELKRTKLRLRQQGPQESVQDFGNAYPYSLMIKAHQERDLGEAQKCFGERSILTVDGLRSSNRSFARGTASRLR